MMSEESGSRRLFVDESANAVDNRTSLDAMMTPAEREHLRRAGREFARGRGMWLLINGRFMSGTEKSTDNWSRTSCGVRSDIRRKVGPTAR